MTIMLTVTCVILAIVQIVQTLIAKRLTAQIEALKSENFQINKDNLFLTKEIEKQARIIVDYQTKTEAEMEHIQTRMDACWKQTADICRRYILYRSADNEIDHIERNL